jgi:hypothetical protein
MFLLRTLFRSLTSSILRLAVLAGVLLLAYLLVARPLLDSADKAIKSTESHPRKAIRCIGRSHGNLERIERCARRF